MSNKLHKHWPAFQLIKNAKSPKFRKSLLQHYSKDSDFCSACREISKNLVRRNFIVKGARADKLRRYKNLITKLAKSKNSKKIRQKLVNQSGGWIVQAIPAIASVIGEIIRTVRRK